MQSCQSFVPRPLLPIILHNSVTWHNNSAALHTFITLHNNPIALHNQMAMQNYVI